MTAAEAAAISHSGTQHLKSLYTKHLLRALIIATSLHLGVIGAYYLGGILGEDDEALPMVRIMKYTDLGPPPSLTNADAAPQVAVSVPITKPSIGVPVPVPDAEVNPEQTIATQEELSEISSPATGLEGDGAGVAIEQDLVIDDEDPPDFVPVEQQPVPVKQVNPVYPDMAKRAGVEGTVWVKILVDKEGKAKKAVVMKSDNEIFDAAAVEAALGWVFTPAMMNNGPVAVWAAVPFRFKLQR
jgi:protein TonB